MSVPAPAAEGTDMTSLENRPHTALMVIDVQHGVVAAAHERDDVVDRIGTLVDRARHAGVPVVWVQHSDDGLRHGTREWEYVPELSRRDHEALVHKSYGDSFEDTDLEEVLDRLGVGHLVLTGAQTDQCIRCTLHGAFARGYDATLVADAHTCEDLTAYGAPPPAEVIAHTNLYWQFQSAPGRQGRTVPTAEVDFG